MQAGGRCDEGTPRIVSRPRHGLSTRQITASMMHGKLSPRGASRQHAVDDMIRLTPCRVRPANNNHSYVEATSIAKLASPRNIKHVRLAHLGTHHILREWAARVIQTRYSQFHRVQVRARRQAEATRAKHRAIAYDIMEALVGDFIRVEFIPDILIDIFTTGLDKYTPHPVEIRAAHQLYESMCREIVAVEVREIVVATVDRLVAAYFTSTEESTQATTQPPWQRLVDSFMAEWVHPLLHEIVLDGVDELVTQYMSAKQHTAMFDAWVQHILAETATTAFREMQREDVLDTVLDEVMCGVLNDIATSEVEAARAANAQLNRERERRLIAQTASTHLLDHAMLRALLELIALKADRLAFKDSCDQFLKTLMLKRLLAIQQQQASLQTVVRSSAVLVACHNHCLQASLGHLVSTLLGAGLDEWEDRIHLEEVNSDASQQNAT
ncbi:hypothetical protein H310_11934 [Aphanomyces invadans]|uniref:Uncharacterized protein n=1 Tax=Aphanomyces invadans TaxID=157072 RepID=A0A024TJT4_9STRA|nr:hypothetical protein H310_11934 [Aphanomyces invadans]ETV94259.1 hypothetical protein H310_11934 [Aphanomyces invadans]|eukprot:XP_008877021.1 hypothetical protein H310_11934 [Aphanomyces invadans]